ncbi:MAG TPA: hypothetical protein VGW77_22640 [Candidatus Binatia bacterium]|jgi:hypothetical protein|nr:hypothetical protein [Candidatus Binatia bacterium]
MPAEKMRGDFSSSITASAFAVFSATALSRKFNSMSRRADSGAPKEGTQALDQMAGIAPLKVQSGKNRTVK